MSAIVHSNDVRDQIGALPTFARNAAANTSYDCEPFPAVVTILAE
jgi:hypothetical protein